MNIVTNLPDKYRDLMKEYHKCHNDELTCQLA